MARKRLKKRRKRDRDGIGAIYEIVGIRIFKRIVLALEKLIHRRDYQNNINYHIRDGSISSLKSFSGYLLYNGIWHILSLVINMIYLAVTIRKPVHFIALDGLVWGMILANLYCIILQRYNYLKIKNHLQKRMAVREKRVEEKSWSLSVIMKKGNRADLQEEYQLVKRIRDCVKEGTECFLSGDDAPVLIRIAECVEPVLYSTRENERGSISKQRYMQTGVGIREHCCVVDDTTRCAAKLQNMFRLEKRDNLLFEFNIITETGECEDAYNRLIHEDSRDFVEFVLEVLEKAYRMCFLYGEGGGVEHESVNPI